MTTVSNNKASFDANTNADINVDTVVVAGKIRQNIYAFSGIALPIFDYVACTYPSSTQEVFTYKTGGSGGSTVAIITINYTDSTKSNILNVAKT